MKIIRNRKILVTGGSGFIGSYLVNTLAPHNQVFNFDYHSAPNQNQAVFLPATSSSINFKKLGIDIIYHLGWKGTPSSNLSWHDQLKLNIGPTIRLINMSKNNDIRHFIFMSSAGAVYGKSPLPYVETQIPHPINSYGKAKLEIENYLHNLAPISFSSVIIRPTNAIGKNQPHKRSFGIIPNIFECANSGKTFHLWGNSKKDYIAVSDLVNAIVDSKILRITKEKINIGSQQVFTSLQILHLIEKSLHKKITLLKHPSKDFDAKKLLVDTTKAQMILDWKPKTKVKDLIVSMSHQQDE